MAWLVHFKTFFSEIYNHNYYIIHLNSNSKIIENSISGAIVYGPLIMREYFPADLASAVGIGNVFRY